MSLRLSNKQMLYQERTYRTFQHYNRLKKFRVVVKETDLFVSADRDLQKETEEEVIQCRMPLENYIRLYPEFLTILTPFPDDRLAHPIVQDMICAGKAAKVGPMAAVAGAVAERVGRSLLNYSQQVIIENGGDIFIKSNHSVTVGILAGDSPLSNKIGLEIDPKKMPISVCTSSGTVGHSLSLGKADAVTVVARSAALADAAATAIGNTVKDKGSIYKGLALANSINGVLGVLIVLGDKLGVKGDLKLIPLGGTT
ncbi:MAG: UPF0280 family protein [Pseudomonadota bacterium]